MENQVERDDAPDETGRRTLNDPAPSDIEEMIRRSREWIERVDRCLRRDDGAREDR